jgi:cbb3-type cytochrome oxidase maturation protein
MEILILLIFVCVVLVGAAVAAFVWTVRQGTFDQADRLALLPLDDEKPMTPTTTEKEEEHGNPADRL